MNTSGCRTPAAHGRLSRAARRSAETQGRPAATSGPDSVAAFYVKERIPIPVLGDAPGEALTSPYSSFSFKSSLSHATSLCH